MSSYAFSDHDQGPPSSPVHESFDRVNCGKGEWVCEHRNPFVAPMAKFRAVAGTEEVQNWASGNNGDAIAFSRGSKAFVAINIGGGNWDTTLKTGLPQGSYCDVINSKSMVSNSSMYNTSVGSKGCTHTVEVAADGSAHLSVSSMGAVAFYV